MPEPARRPGPTGTGRRGARPGPVIESVERSANCTGNVLEELYERVVGKGCGVSHASIVSPTVSIRPAIPSDLNDICALIIGLAEYENLRHEVAWTPDMIGRSLFGEQPAASVLMAIKQPYNLNVAASDAIVAAIDDQELLDQRACTMTGTREKLAGALAAIDWIHPYPSEANFILCRLDGVDAVEVKDRLANRGIFVRYFDTPMLRNHLRISVGLPEHTDIVASALREIGAELGR